MDIRSQLDPVVKRTFLASPIDSVSDAPATPTVQRVAGRFAAGVTVRVADASIPTKLCNANPARKTLVLTGQTPTGAYALGGPPGQGEPKPSDGTSQVSGTPLIGQQTVAIDTTGEVWAIMDPSNGGAGFIRVCELV
jgi:hypothetical protein